MQATGTIVHVKYLIHLYVKRGCLDPRVHLTTSSFVIGLLFYGLLVLWFIVLLFVVVNHILLYGPTCHTHDDDVICFFLN